MKAIVAVFTLGVGLVFAASVARAQTENSSDSGAKVTDLEINLMRKDLRDQKKQVVAANLSLNGDEAARFWPVYDAYTQQTIKINDRRYTLFKEYAANYNTMTDVQASSYIRRWNEVDGRFHESQARVDSKVRASARPPKKTAAFFQIIAASAL